MEQTVCPVCGSSVDSLALACSSCGAALSDTPPPSAREQRAVLRLPDADRRRARRLQWLAAAATALLVFTLGWLVVAWWPAYLGDHVEWDRGTDLPRHSTNGRWELRGVDFGGFGPDSQFTTWLQVRRRGAEAWRTIYVGEGADTIRWLGDRLVIEFENTEGGASVDVRGAARGGKQFDGGFQVLLLVALALLAVGLVFLILRLPHVIAWRRARALVRRVLAEIDARCWREAAGLLGSDAGVDDLVAGLEDCVAARLLVAHRARLSRTRRIGWEPVSGWQVAVRFCDRVWPLQVASEAHVRSTLQGWLLVPGVGLLAPGDEAPEEEELPRGPGGAVFAAIALGLVGGLVGLVPVIGPVGLLAALIGLVMAVVACVRLSRRGGPLWLAVVALCVCALALLPGLVINAALFWLLTMPPTTFWH